MSDGPPAGLPPGGMPTPGTFEDVIYTPIFFGTVLGGVFYGCFLLCAYLYIAFHPDKFKTNKIIVAILVVLISLDMAVDFARLYLLTVKDYGNVIAGLTITGRPLEWVTFLSSALPSILCQAFMSYRIVAFTRAMRHTYWPIFQRMVTFLPYLMLLIWMNSAAGAIGLPIMVALQPSYIPFVGLPYIYWPAASVLAMDCLITVLMCLVVGLAKTGFESSNVVLNSILSVVLRNGILVTALQIAQVIQVRSHTTWSQFCIPMLGKVHGITLVSFLTLPQIAQAQYFKKQSAIEINSGETAVADGSNAAGSPKAVLSRMPTPAVGGIGTPHSRCVHCGTPTPSTMRTAVRRQSQVDEKLQVEVGTPRRQSGLGISFLAALEDPDDDESDKGEVDTASLEEKKSPSLIRVLTARSPSILQRISNSPR